MSTTEPQIDDQTAHAIYHSIHHTHKALREVADLLEAQTQRVSVGGSPVDRVLENWPTPGLTRRVLSDRRASGTDSFAATATTALLVVEAFPGRLGGRIVNIGTGSCVLYLCRPEQISAISAGNAAIGLAAAAAGKPNDFWDLQFGDVPWGGAVSVISTAGTTLTVAQF